MNDWKYFKMDEYLNPLFDGCLYNRWSDISESLREKCSRVMAFVDYIRGKIGKPIRLNSTIRNMDRPWSPHRNGAVDFIVIEQYYLWEKDIIRIIQGQEIFIGFRIFWEWSGRMVKSPDGQWHPCGWIHIDVMGKKDRNVFMVGYPYKTWYGKQKMKYSKYDGKAPWELSKV